MSVRATPIVRWPAPARPNHGKPPTGDHRPRIAGRPVSPAIAEFMAERSIGEGRVAVTESPACKHCDATGDVT